MHIDEGNLSVLDVQGPHLQSLLDQGRHDELLREAKRLLSIDPDDFNVCQTAARFLIDGGSDAQNLEAINAGMVVIERLLRECPKLDEEFTIRFRYNLSNGYGARYHYFRARNQPGEADVELQAQKEILQG
ncbi:MAG TPA: hypothetical protein VGC93_16335, partial [Thermoanaerobaculia bacterium]